MFVLLSIGDNLRGGLAVTPTLESTDDRRKRLKAIADDAGAAEGTRDEAPVSHLPNPFSVTQASPAAQSFSFYRQARPLCHVLSFA